MTVYLITYNIYNTDIIKAYIQDYIRPLTDNDMNFIDSLYGEPRQAYIVVDDESIYQSNEIPEGAIEFGEYIFNKLKR